MDVGFGLADRADRIVGNRGIDAAGQHIGGRRLQRPPHAEGDQHQRHDQRPGLPGEDRRPLLFLIDVAEFILG